MDEDHIRVARRRRIMQGRVLHMHESGGIITGDNQERHTCSDSDVKGNMTQIVIRSRVDFVAFDATVEKQAKEIYPLSTPNVSYVQKSEKEKLVAFFACPLPWWVGDSQILLGL